MQIEEDLESLVSQSINRAQEEYNKGNFVYAGAVLTQLHKVTDATENTTHLLSLCHRATGKYRLALDTLRPYLRSGAPWTVLNTGAVLCNDVGEYQQAIEYLNLITEPSLNPVVENNRSLSLMNLGHFDDAVTLLEWVIGEQCDIPQIMRLTFNLGNIYMAWGQHDKALECYNKCLEHDPDMNEARWNRSHAQLAMGQYKGGWQDYEVRWKIFKHLNEKLERYTSIAPPWSGEPLDGKSILLYSEQGAGDTIQFLRFARQLKDMGAKVCIEWPRSSIRGDLVPILRQVPFIDEVIDVASPNQCDYQQSLTSLPFVLGIDSDSQIASKPYISAVPKHSPELSKHLWQEYEHDIRIGLVWAGSSIHPKDIQRSIAFNTMVPVLWGVERKLKKCKATFFSLQVGSCVRNYPGGRVDLAEGFAGSGVVDLSHYIVDFNVTANLLTKLDLLVTVDTAVAHIAGAMGKPCIVILPSEPEWRWRKGDTDCVWYKSVSTVQRAGKWQCLLADRIVIAMQPIANKRKKVTLRQRR